MIRIFCLLFACLSPVLAEAQPSDHLVILSPHRKSIQDEFLPRFKDYYQRTTGKPVEVEWLDNGGTADAVRLLRTRFEKNKDTAGIDLFWGGGTGVFLDLSRQHLLARFPLPKALQDAVPAEVAGVSLYDQSETWYASALSSFGIFFNRQVLALEGLEAPASWEDLSRAKFLGQVAQADPRHSGTAITMNLIVLQALGWDKGWQLLTEIAGNTKTFTHSSSDPIKAVVAGDSAAAMAIDFYAQPKIDELGKNNLGFVLPTGQTVLDPDPVAIIRGAPDQAVAQSFLTWLLSPEAQKLLILPKGATDGPKIETLGRMAVNKQAYAQTEGKRTSVFNPFLARQTMRLDVAKVAKLERITQDLIGAVLVDTHSDLEKAWRQVVKVKDPKEADKAKAELAKMPVTEAELLKLADSWDDNVVRNKTINAWVDFAKTKYRKLAGN